MVRDLAVRVLFVLLLAAAGGLAWLTQHPDSAILHRARGWPVIGPWAERFQEAYLPRRTVEPPPEEIEIVYLEGRRPQDYSEKEVDAMVGRPMIWVRPGMEVRAGPDPSAPSLVGFDLYANLPSLERRGDWHRIRYQGREGWVRHELPPVPEGPPLGSAPAPVLPLPAAPPDPEILAAARTLLSGPEIATRVGPYALYTDVDDPDLLGFLDRVAARLEATYVGRYGLRPVGEPDGALVLYRRRRDYLAFEERQGNVAGLGAAGLATRGILAADVEGRERAEIGATLVHELTHLLNRRALGPALPPWLDEGLADDLAASRLEDDGRLATDRVGGVALRQPARWEWRGPLASAIEVRRAYEEGRLPRLPELVTLDWAEFVAPPDGSLRYAVSGFWVRQLLSGDQPGPTAGFRAFLASVAAGEPATGEELTRRLGRSWPQLEADFRRWIVLRLHGPLEVALDPEGDRP